MAEREVDAEETQELALEDGWDEWREAPRLSYAEMEEGAAAPPPGPGPVSGRSWSVWAVVVLVLAAAGLGGWLLLDLARSEEPVAGAGAGARHAVPDVVGRKVDEAVAALRDVGFATEVRRRPSDRPVGVVFAQDPSGGDRADVGERIVLFASSGPPEAPVPKVVGLDVEAAGVRLAESGLEAETRSVFAEQPAGVVVRQAPRPGVKVEPGSTVALTVSKGPRPVTVPGVAGLPLADAVAALEGAGLAADAYEVPSELPVGTVVAQSPREGERAARGDAVRLNVSAGPPPEARPKPKPKPAPARVPDVVGLKLEEAEEQLAEAGYDVEVVEEATDDRRERGRVIAQEPAAGEGAREGVVTLYVGVLED